MLEPLSNNQWSCPMMWQNSHKEPLARMTGSYNPIDDKPTISIRCFETLTIVWNFSFLPSWRNFVEWTPLLGETPKKLINIMIYVIITSIHNVGTFHWMFLPGRGWDLRRLELMKKNRACNISWDFLLVGV